MGKSLGRRLHQNGERPPPHRGAVGGAGSSRPQEMEQTGPRSSMIKRMAIAIGMHRETKKRQAGV